MRFWQHQKFHAQKSQQRRLRKHRFVGLAGTGLLRDSQERIGSGGLDRAIRINERQAAIQMMLRKERLAFPCNDLRRPVARFRFFERGWTPTRQIRSVETWWQIRANDRR